MKNATFTASFKTAFKGILYAFSHEKNFKYYLMNFAAALIINLMIKVPVYCHLYYMITIAGVCSAESMNTAMEYMADYVCPEFNKIIGALKDMAAAAVLWWGLAFYIGEGAMVLKWLF